MIFNYTLMDLTSLQPHERQLLIALYDDIDKKSKRRVCRELL